MAWSTPKTDWYGAVGSDGTYAGDRFNAEDFNRIKNNLVYVRELSLTLYEDFPIISVGDDRTPADYFYADEINQMEDNLRTINENTLQVSYGTAPVYVDNGPTPDYKELNRLEGAILDLYNKLNTQRGGRRNLSWNLEAGGSQL